MSPFPLLRQLFLQIHNPVLQPIVVTLQPLKDGSIILRRSQAIHCLLEILDLQIHIPYSFRTQVPANDFYGSSEERWHLTSRYNPV